MKLADSLNPATQAENIKKLNAGLEAVDAKTLPDTSTATTGQILKLTGENKTPSWADEYSYTPPAFSETEVNTGKKWIDSKDIYVSVFTDTFNNDSSAKEVGVISCDSLLQLYVSTIDGNNTKYCVSGSSFYVLANGSVRVSTTTTAFQGKDCIVVVYYTKPAPAPETRDDENPEEQEAKKTTRKKTTK